MCLGGPGHKHQDDGGGGGGGDGLRMVSHTLCTKEFMPYVIAV